MKAEEGNTERDFVSRLCEAEPLARFLFLSLFQQAGILGLLLD